MYDTGLPWNIHRQITAIIHRLSEMSTIAWLIVRKLDILYRQ